MKTAAVVVILLLLSSWLPPLAASLFTLPMPLAAAVASPSPPVPASSPPARAATGNRTGRLLLGNGPRSLARQGKFLKLFTLVRFKNEECQTSSGRRGTCQSLDECSRNDGTHLGICAMGFGVCCVYEATCGGSVEEEVAYFTSVGASSVGYCALTVRRSTDKVVQLRLTFVAFLLAPPNTSTGVCDGDVFVVSSASPISPICGNNTNQHMHVELGRSFSSAVLNVVSSAAYSQRLWTILIEQLTALSPLLAPSGCLQHFTGTSGMLRSFNFFFSRGSLQLADQNYAICVRAAAGFCGIQYRACALRGGGALPFSLTGVNANDVPYPGLNDGQNAALCQLDFLQVPCGSAFKGAQYVCYAERFCGGAFNANLIFSSGNHPVYSYLRPFILRFKTDVSEPSLDLRNSGFCLTYSQQPCM